MERGAQTLGLALLVLVVVVASIVGACQAFGAAPATDADGGDGTNTVADASTMTGDGGEGGPPIDDSGGTILDSSAPDAADGGDDGCLFNNFVVGSTQQVSAAGNEVITNVLANAYGFIVQVSTPPTTVRCVWFYLVTQPSSSLVHVGVYNKGGTNAPNTLAAPEVTIANTKVGWNHVALSSAVSVQPNDAIWIALVPSADQIVLPVETNCGGYLATFRKNHIGNDALPSPFGGNPDNGVCKPAIFLGR